MKAEIAIPELDALAEQEPDRVPWSEHDEEILRKYYGRGAVTVEDLREYLDCKTRTKMAIQQRASTLGAAGRR